ncbi:nuclear transport factor 2 family protein [Pseudonocardia sp. KRD-169]|uniref:Nuclear transport factor 2 family protein n=1 Tax=Pseudonocardia abyssalis TaxID=2792008 RepID=A0ABS6URC3_9PSEU|nr:nuclear transport factor 2 family protein [Pseudonocardia abyssalis]MBW0134486.1 nuclear transport factor 2 family protein [Pseudonocardia abyssalis]
MSAFRDAVHAGDVDAAVALFAPDAVFVSPVVHQTYVGRDALRAILTAVVSVFEDFTYTDAYGDDDGRVLVFTARVGDRALQGVDILRAVDGVLTELTVMVRPYSAATALRERMAALLTP